MADVTCRSCGANNPVGPPMCRQCGANLAEQHGSTGTERADVRSATDRTDRSSQSPRPSTTYLLVAPELAWEVTGILRVGRDPAWSDVADDLDERDLVSRHHATLWVEDGHLFVQDEGSTNGTLVNGEACLVGRRHRLAVGDRLRMSSHLQLTVSTHESESRDERQMERRC